MMRRGVFNACYARDWTRTWVNSTFPTVRMIRFPPSSCRLCASLPLLLHLQLQDSHHALHVVLFSLNRLL